jgi:hypothetical protein
MSDSAKPKPGEVMAMIRQDCIDKTGIDPRKPNVPPLGPKPPKLASVPVYYSETVANAICDLLLEGQTMASICARPDMPSRISVWQWEKDKPDFADRLQTCKKEGSHYIADDCLRIADDPSIDPMHKRIMVDTRLRLIKSWHRKAYGDNVQLTGDENGSPVKFFIEGLSDQPRTVEPIALQQETDKPKG